MATRLSNVPAQRSEVDPEALTRAGFAVPYSLAQGIPHTEWSKR